MRLVDLADVVGQMSTTPVLKAVNGSTAALDQGSVFIDHSGHLLALVGMNKKNDLVMSH